MGGGFEQISSGLKPSMDLCECGDGCVFIHFFVFGSAKELILISFCSCFFVTYIPTNILALVGL